MNNVVSASININWEAIAAGAAVVAVLVAIATLINESKRSRFALGIDLLLRLDQYFNSERMIKLRRTAAQSVLDGTYKNVDEVLDFLETIGLLIYHGALDKEMVWHIFSPWVIGYCQGAEEYINTERQEDDTVWSNCLDLYKRILAIEKKALHRSENKVKLSKENLEKFLHEEATLSP